MADTFDTISTVLTADVANAGTFTVGYLTNRDPGYYTGGFDHRVVSNPYGSAGVVDGKAAFSFGASTVTITNNSGVTWKAGTRVTVQLDRVGPNSIDIPNVLAATTLRVARASLAVINLGAPDAAVANGVLLSAALNTGVNGTPTGSLATGGVATFDVPRNVVAAWTNTAVITVTGTDEYGNAMTESSASGTSFTGKKAFKTVTNVTVSANVTGLTVGTGTVLGLPIFLAGTGHVLRELQDGAAPTAGTIVAGVTTKATATTGDVRGTYAPNAAPDGAKAFQLVCAIGDLSFRGVPQA